MVTNIVSESKKLVFSLREHALAEGEKAVLRKDLNFAVSFPHSNVDLVYLVASLVPQVCWHWAWTTDGKISLGLEKSKLSVPSATKQELHVTKPLKEDKDLGLLYIDKGNSTNVMGETATRGS